jgi:hypothetical protein
VRYDEFNVLFRNNRALPGSEDGHAWALAYTYDPGKQWRFALEWLQVDSTVPERVVQFGEPAFASETKIEFSARYLLSGSF